jgi:hypothetical protein
MSLFYQPLLDDSPTGLYLGGMAGATVLATVGPVGAMVGSAYAAKTTPLGPCPSHIRLFSSSADTKISTNIGTSIAWTTFTCECLFMPLVMSPCAVVSKTMYYASSTTQFPLSLWMQPDGRLQLHLDNGSDWVPNSMTDSAAGVMVRGQLHHVVVIIRASGQCEVYVNNVRVIDVTVAFNLSTSGVPFTFGGPAQNYAGGVGWQGAIGLFAAMAVYPTALSAARVEAHYNALLSSAYVKGTVKVAGAPTAGLKVRAYNRESGELAGECTTGTVLDANGSGAERRLRAYRRDTGAMVAEGLSLASTGDYVLELPGPQEVSVLCLDDTAGATEQDLVRRAAPG